MSLSAAAGCGGGGDSSSRASGPRSAAAVKVDIANFAYHPPTITLRRGGKVTWTNGDTAPHTATASDQRSFDTGTLSKGASDVVTFSRAGTYRYFCRFHPFMHGTVVVR